MLFRMAETRLAEIRVHLESSVLPIIQLVSPALSYLMIFISPWCYPLVGTKATINWKQRLEGNDISFLKMIQKKSKKKMKFSRKRCHNSYTLKILKIEDPFSSIEQLCQPNGIEIVNEFPKILRKASILSHQIGCRGQRNQQHEALSSISGSSGKATARRFGKLVTRYFCFWVFERAKVCNSYSQQTRIHSILAFLFGEILWSLVKNLRVFGKAASKKNRKLLHNRLSSFFNANFLLRVIYDVLQMTSKLWKEFSNNSEIMKQCNNPFNKQWIVKRILTLMHNFARKPRSFRRKARIECIRVCWL